MKGVSFGGKHSYDDFGLILTSKSIGIPKAKREEVEIEGMDGKIDLTYAITDDIKFENRDLQFTFTVIGHQSNFFSALSQLSNYLHGKTMQVIIDDDAGYYYTGACSINKFQTDKRTATIVVDVDADPYKMMVTGVGDPWTSDTFSFADGYIYISEITVTDTAEVNLYNGRRVVSPWFTCSAEMTATYNDTTVTIPANVETQVLDFRLQEGDNYVTFMGTGTVNIKYKGGSL